LVRYEPSGKYFARLRVRGKLIRRSLKTTQLSVAKLRLTDLEKGERQKAEHQTAVADGRMTFGDALGIPRPGRVHQSAAQLAILLQLLIRKREALRQVWAANVRGVGANPGGEFPGAFL
jgi:hypothetical protein